MATKENTAESTEGQDVAATDNNGVIVALVDKDKVTSIRKALGDRRYFTTTTINDENGKAVTKTAYEQAESHLADAATKTDTFHGLRVFAREGLESAERIVVATVGTRQKATADAVGINGYKAIVVFSQPSVAEFVGGEIANQEAADFVTKLIEREATDVQFSALRQAETYAQMEQAVTGIPLDVSGIISTSRESGNGLDTDAFDNMWQPFRSGWLKAKAAALVDLLPQKPEVIKAIRSKSYALANPKTKAIEEKGFFVRIAMAMVALAPEFKDKDGKADPQDASSITAWIESRDATAITYKAETIADTSVLAGLDF